NCLARARSPRLQRFWDKRTRVSRSQVIKRALQLLHLRGTKLVHSNPHLVNREHRRTSLINHRTSEHMQPCFLLNHSTRSIRRSTPPRFLNLLRVANLSTLALLPCVTSSVLSRLVRPILTRLTCFLGEPVNGVLVKCLHNELDR